MLLNTETQHLNDQQKRLYWRARRGLLELDCVLRPFLENELATLTEEEGCALADFLLMEDPDMWKAFTHPDESHPHWSMIKRILAAAEQYPLRK